MSLRRLATSISTRTAARTFTTGRVPAVAALTLSRVAARAGAVQCAAPTLMASSVRCYADAGSEEGASKASPYLLDRDVVKQRVVDVVKNFEKVDANKVTENSHFMNDLGLDSLDVVEVVMALEQEFVLDIPDHDAEKLLSIQEAVDYIAANPMAK